MHSLYLAGLVVQSQARCSPQGGPAERNPSVVTLLPDGLTPLRAVTMLVSDLGSVKSRNMRNQRTWATLALAFLAAGAIAFSSGSLGAGSATAAGKSGFTRSDLDAHCKPCEDFYEFATGGWEAHNPIQPAYSSWGRFSALQDQNQAVLRRILEEAAKQKKAAHGSLDQKIGDFYASCMDTGAIEAQGKKPLEDEMTRIAEIQTLQQFEDEAARLQSHGIRALLFFDSGQDDKDSTRVIAQAFQGGLGLPDRDYYLKPDDRFKQIREKYRQHVAHMLVLAGDAPDAAVAEAQAVLAIETQLAQASRTAVQMRDPQANYNKMSLAEFLQLTPSIEWRAYFRDLGFPSISTVNVGEPEYFQALDKELTTVPLNDWKTYLRWYFLHGAVSALPSRFIDENFDFYDRTLNGTKELPPRWKRCVASADRSLGEALGQKYVAAVFRPGAKAEARAMVDNLVAALRSDLQTLPWMSEPTRQQALAKLDTMMLKIGYPDKWRDYSGYEVVRDSYFQNLWRSSEFDYQWRMNKIGKPVDRTEWQMTPPTVNAYYDPEMNEIVFPAGILQPPFFDAKGNRALNYGGIGAVIGHEMTHAFDDSGSQYDAQGNLRNWWTPEDRKNFDARAACVQKQFDGFVVSGTLHENGKLVLGEAIADLGGLTISHIAFERSLQETPEPKKRNGYTEDQLFFLGFARIWANNSRPEFEQSMVVVNPHPLPRFRVRGPLQNMPEFAAAFSCQAGEPMVAPAGQRCKIW